jgi:hypothetical protein
MMGWVYKKTVGKFVTTAYYCGCLAFTNRRKTCLDAALHGSEVVGRICHLWLHLSEHEMLGLRASISGMGAPLGRETKTKSSDPINLNGSLVNDVIIILGGTIVAITISQ